MRALRLLAIGWMFHFKMIMRSAFDGVGQVIYPLFFATVAFPAAWALGNMFEYPVWLICGFLVPLTFFPDWVRPISWVLAPTWGMNAIRQAALGGSPLDDLGMCFLLGATYVTVGILLTDR